MRSGRAIGRGLGGGSVSGSVRVHAAKLPSVSSVTNVLDHGWQWRWQPAFKRLERRQFTRKNLDRQRAIDTRFRASCLGLAHSGSRENDEPTALSLVELQCMTAALQVSLIGVE